MRKVCRFAVGMGAFCVFVLAGAPLRAEDPPAGGVAPVVADQNIPEQAEGVLEWVQNGILVAAPGTLKCTGPEYAGEGQLECREGIVVSGGSELPTPWSKGGGPVKFSSPEGTIWLAVTE